MKKIILLIGLIVVSILGFSQKPFQVPNGIIVPEGKLKIGSTSVTATGLEINRAAVGAKSVLQTQADSIKAALLLKLSISSITTIGNNILGSPNPGAVTFGRANANNTFDWLSAPNFRTAIGGTDIGQAYFTLTNPGAVTFPRMNVNNSLDARTAAEMRADLNVPLASDTVPLTSLVYLKAQTKAVAQTRVDSLGLISKSHLLKSLQAFGSPIVALPVSANGVLMASNADLVDGQLEGIGFYLPVATTITGVRWVQPTSGTYNADNYNGFKLYSISGTTYTRQDSTANDGAIWKPTAYALASKVFSKGATIYPAGAYYISFIWNTSDASPAVKPKLYSNYPLGGKVQAIIGSNRLNHIIPSLTDLPITYSYNTSGIADATSYWSLFLY